jgi:hypothetical protein
LIKYKQDKVASWYFAWFTFWINALMVRAIFFNVIVQPFTMALELSR